MCAYVRPNCNVKLFELVSSVVAIVALQLVHHCWRNSLLLNPDKSEVIFGTRQWLHSTDLPTSISIAGSIILVSLVIKNLIVTLDSTLSFNDHVSDVVRACNYHMRALRHIRRYVSRDVVRWVAFSNLSPDFY